MTKYKILAIDDEPGNLQIINQVLKDQYQLAFCNKGTEAYASAVKHMPDLILLDIMMPEMDGYKVCEQIKANP